MAAIDIATHGRMAISQKGNVAERKNFSKVRIEEWPGSHKVAHTPRHLAGRVVKGEAEISNDSLQARCSPKPPGMEKKLPIRGIFFRRRPGASRGPRASQHACRSAHQRQASTFDPAQSVGARIACAEKAKSRSMKMFWASGPRKRSRCRIPSSRRS